LWLQDAPLEFPQGGERDMLFAVDGRATRNFCSSCILMHSILFVDRANVAAAAG
jgi:hypothetical protein